MRKGVAKVGDKANKILNISRLKIEMAERKNAVDEKYKLIGKYAYDMFINNDNFDFDDISDWLEEIKILQNGIKECENQINKVKEKSLCKYCKSSNESGARFCSNCGKSFYHKNNQAFSDDLEDDFTEQEIKD